MSKDLKKAIKLASKKLPFRASKAIEQNLSCAEEAQGEIIARLRAELGKNAVHSEADRGRAHEPPAGVKCTHCNGKGYNEPIYDEQDGWIDETPCETCNGSGRITTVEQYLKTLPANWHEDSSLETWFPITAEELKRLKDERASQPPDDLLADLREIEGELMCFGGVGHHCSRCDNSTYDLSQKVRRLIDRLSPIETAPEGRGVRDNPPPHALGSSEGADTHSRLSEPDAANVAKPHDDPTAHRVADLRAQSQPTNETSGCLKCHTSPCTCVSYQR